MRSKNELYEIGRYHLGKKERLSASTDTLVAEVMQANMEMGKPGKLYWGADTKLCRIRLTEEVAVLCIIQYALETPYLVLLLNMEPHTRKLHR